MAVAGTPTTLASLAQGSNYFEPNTLEGFKLDRCAVGDLYESLAIQTNATRKAVPILASGRYDVIVSGASILLTAMEYFEKESVIVSTRGLRHGVLLDPSLLKS